MGTIEQRKTRTDQMFQIQFKNRKNHNKWTPAFIDQADYVSAHSSLITNARVYSNETFRLVDLSTNQIILTIYAAKAA